MLSFRALGVSLVAIGLSGCHSMAHVSPQKEATAAKPFEIRFTPARNVDAVYSDGTRRLLPEVVRATGNFARSQQDSVAVNIFSWTRAGENDEHAEAGGLTATFAVADGGVSYQRRHFSPVKTLLLLGSIGGAIALAVGQADIARPGNIGPIYDVLHFSH